jgi:hypothetical protein
MKNEKSENNCKTGWRYHFKKPIGFLAILPACLLYVVFVLDWILYFKSYLFISTIIMLSPLVLIPICVITAVCQLIKKNVKNFIFLLVPLIITTLLFSFPYLDHAIESHSRYQAEFLIQKYLYIPEIAAISSGKEPGVTYKEWSIPSGRPNMNFWIVYDVTDNIAKKNGLHIPDGPYTNECMVYHLEGHFYMMSMFYGGMIWY